MVLGCQHLNSLLPFTYAITREITDDLNLKLLSLLATTISISHLAHSFIDHEMWGWLLLEFFVFVDILRLWAEIFVVHLVMH